MIVIFGEKSYGKVDRVPGVCYVVTTFAHLNFLPLVPLRSYIVIEGTESGGEFRGKQIGISFKSMVAGYTRVWFGLLALITCGFGYFGLGAFADQLKISPAFAYLAWATGIAAISTLWIRGKVGGGILVVVLLLSAVLWFVYSTADWAVPPARRQGNLNGGLLMLIVANVALLVFGLTRLLDRAGPDRRRELLSQLGVELPTDDESDEEPRESRWEDWDESEDRRRR